MQKQNVQNLIFFGVFALFFILVARLFMPFLTVILWSAIFLIFANPLYQRLSGERRAKRTGKRPPNVRRAVAAGVVSIGSVLVVVVPLGLLAYLLLRQSGELVADIIDYLNGPSSPFQNEASLRAFIGRASGGLVDDAAFAAARNALIQWTGGEFDLARVDEVKAASLKFLRDNQALILRYSGQAVRGFGSFLVSTAFMVFTLYFFLIDGAFLLDLFSRAVPIKGEYMGSLVQRFRDTTKQIVRGNILVAIIQGLVALGLFAAFRVRGALLLAFLVSVCSFIPMVGSGLVWFPVGISYVFVRSPGLGFLLLGLSAVLISLLANFYRPLLVGGPIKMHPLPLFFAIVGGVSIFGVNGLIIGPLVLVLFLTVLEIFRDLYKITKDGVPAEPEGAPAAPPAGKRSRGDGPAAAGGARPGEGREGGAP